MDISTFFNKRSNSTSMNILAYNSTSTYAVPLSTLFMLTNYKHYFFALNTVAY